MCVFFLPEFINLFFGELTDSTIVLNKTSSIKESRSNTWCHHQNQFQLSTFWPMSYIWNELWLHHFQIDEMAVLIFTQGWSDGTLTRCCSAVHLSWSSGAIDRCLGEDQSLGEAGGAVESWSAMDRNSHLLKMKVTQLYPIFSTKVMNAKRRNVTRNH